MSVGTWTGDAITTSESVKVGRPLSGAELRDSYFEAIQDLTLGLVRWDDKALRLGPLELIRLGDERVDRHSVEWRIEGGLIAKPGGRWRIQSEDGVVSATASGHRPVIPRPLYDVSHLQVHLLATRLFLLRLRRHEAPPGIEAVREDRLRAAAVDVAFCLTLARITGRRRLGRTFIITAAYHVACWSLFSQTLGGIVMRERVVSLDGSRPTPAQAMLRFALLPLSWIARRPLHDEVAATTVITDR